MDLKVNPKIAVYVPARNEEQYLGKTLTYLNSLKGNIEICVVNDGSSDETERIAFTLADTVISLTDRGNKLGRPELAEVHNIGLQWCKTIQPDYALIVGADHLLPPSYIQELLKRMTPTTAIASGSFKGEYLVPENPSGSGRLVPSWFLDHVGWQYPIMWGWESYWIFKAWQLGFKTRCYSDVETVGQRPNRAQSLKLPSQLAKYYGYGMKQLGYHPLYTLARALLFMKTSPLTALNLLAGYCYPMSKCDIAPVVREHQRKMLTNAVSKRINHIVK